MLVIALMQHKGICNKQCAQNKANDNAKERISTIEINCITKRYCIFQTQTDTRNAFIITCTLL